MGPYVACSAFLHAAAVAAALLLLKGGPGAQRQAYYIDFIGQTGVIANRVLETSQSKARETQKATPAQPLVKDDFAIRGRKSKPLPRPSILEGTGAKTVGAKQEGPRAAEGPSVQTDLSDFPYPWYVAQVRSGLWNRWSARTGLGGAECVIVFSILRTGQAVDFRVEASSGDAGFDYEALSATQEASPFPPLPREYEDPFLKIHVSFRGR